MGRAFGSHRLLHRGGIDGQRQRIARTGQEVYQSLMEEHRAPLRRGGARPDVYELDRHRRDLSLSRDLHERGGHLFTDALPAYIVRSSSSAQHLPVLAVGACFLPPHCRDKTLVSHLGKVIGLPGLARGRSGD